MKKLCLLHTLCLISLIGFSQNPRKEFPIGLNLNIGGPSFIIGVSADAFVIPSINIEAGIGTGFLMVPGSFFGGIKYHSDAHTDSYWTFYSGLMGIAATTSYSSERPTSKLFGLVYLPVGTQYIADNGFTFSVEVAGLYDKNADLYANHFGVWVGVKIGFHFNFKDNIPKPPKRKTTYKDENIEYHPNY